MEQQISFKELELSKEIMMAIEDLNFETATEIQSKANYWVKEPNGRNARVRRRNRTFKIKRCII